MAVDIGGIDDDGLAGTVGSGKTDLFQDLFQDRMQPPGADIFQIRVHFFGQLGDRVDGVVGKLEMDFLPLVHLFLIAIVSTALIQKRRAGYDGFDQSHKAVIIIFETFSHLIEQHIVGNDQRAAQGIR